MLVSLWTCLAATLAGLGLVRFYLYSFTVTWFQFFVLSSILSDITLRPESDFQIIQIRKFDKCRKLQGLPPKSLSASQSKTSLSRLMSYLCFYGLPGTILHSFFVFVTKLLKYPSWQISATLSCRVTVTMPCTSSVNCNAIKPKCGLNLHVGSFADLFV